MAFNSKILAQIPTVIEEDKHWLVDYWCAELRVSRNKLKHAISKAGKDVSRIKKQLRESITLVIPDAVGVLRSVAKITWQRDGVGFSLPYSPYREGIVFETPMVYDKTFGTVPFNRHYVVSDTVKLSVHFDGGFVQFSKGGEKPILSGFNKELNAVKGAGLRIDHPVDVSSGPLFGGVARGIEEFESYNGGNAEIFLDADIWRHPRLSTPPTCGFNIEVFMIPRSRLNEVRFDRGEMKLLSELPFLGMLKFRFELRIVEFPDLPVALGIIVHPVSEQLGSGRQGYSIGGPGCAEPDGPMRGLGAMYPRPSMIDPTVTPSLDYTPPSPSGK